MLATHDLAVGVVGGVFVATVLLFAWGNDLTARFACVEDPVHVVVDLNRSQVWVASSVTVLDAVADPRATLPGDSAHGQ